MRGKKPRTGDACDPIMEIIQLERDREMIGILPAATGPLLLTIAFTSSSCHSDSEREMTKDNKAVAAW